MTSELNIGNLKTGLGLDIDLKHFRYAHAEADVLQDIKLNISPGTVTVINGGSGSGKSTLGAILAGILPRTGLDQFEGAITVGGRRIEFSEDKRPRIDPSGWAQHISFLPQDVNDYLSGIRATVAEEMAFALENRGAPREDMLTRILAVVDMLDIKHLLTHDAGTLSGGQARIVALGALMVDNPQVLVLDEPFSGLDKNARKVVLSAIQQLKLLGKAIVVLTRNHVHGADHADKVLRLENHESLFFERNSLPPNQEPNLDKNSLQPAGRDRSRVLLEFAGTNLGYGSSTPPTISGFNLKLHAGECLGLLGPNGVGKTTILKAAVGLLKPTAGTVRTSAKPGLLLQNPNDQLFERTVFKEVGYGLRPGAKSQQQVAAVLDRLDLRDKAETHPYELSMSERKLVALASVLVHEPEILLLDEPTEGLDDNGIKVLREILEVCTSKGHGILFTSHDDSFVAHAATRTVQLNASENAR
ncbi:ATP-binding cassette domain-containing protein [Glutamicibacter soli]|uniref:ATP-binding cassette domain-containing protein n=1 Tax=Glutamicibacter soli TaxID=453836 RepID=A0A6L9G854_9MICC|nr:ABC transporter ATP-binding protein [Glutamicibacter soli]NAZ17347.1 ATP-binding cassette domain-containing protein [Glutamicibacter soli]